MFKFGSAEARAGAGALDRADPLAGFRDRFVCDEATVYLKGNSLGPMPKSVLPLAQDLLERQWAERRVRGWNEGWYDLPVRIGGKIAELIGAGPDEVIVADSTSVNLHKLTHAALELQRRRHGPARNCIVTTRANFPSDLYIFDGLAEVISVGDVDDPWIDPALIEAELGERTALLSLSLVEFRSAQWHDLARLSAAAHAAGALVLWDLSHAVGSVPVHLSGLDFASADLAVGCGYKYLNGGPGAPAFLYVRQSLQSELQNPIPGWFGHANPFEFSGSYAPAEGMRRWLSGTPPILSLACLEAGVDLVREAGRAEIRAKSELMLALFEAGYRERLAPLGFRWLSPSESSQRGSHAVLGHDHAHSLSLALAAEHAVITDFRKPFHLRLGFSPLSNTFSEVVRAVEAIEQVAGSVGLERYVAKGPVT